MSKSKWVEIRNTFFNDEEQCFCIDAFETNDDSEEGKIIAKVKVQETKLDEELLLTVIYLDKEAITDIKAQESISELITDIEKDFYDYKITTTTITFLA